MTTDNGQRTTDQTARPVGFEPTLSALETNCSPRSTTLSSCPGRSRTFNRPVNSRPLYRLSYKAITVRMVGFEPTISSTPSWRIARLSHILPGVCADPAGSCVACGLEERPGGFEPPHPPWQGGRLPGYIMDADPFHFRFQIVDCRLKNTTSTLKSAITNLQSASSGGWNRTNTLPSSAGRSTFELHRNNVRCHWSLVLRPWSGPNGQGPVTQDQTTASGGSRTHSSRFTRAGVRPVGARRQIRVTGGSRTHTTPGHSRVPQPLWVRSQYPRQESNLQPPPSQGGVPPPHSRDEPIADFRCQISDCM